MPGSKILLVEDDVLTHWTLDEALTAAGHDVIGASRGEQALGLMASVRDFRLLLTDLDLPGSLDGAELAQVWRRRWPGRPVVTISSRPATTRPPPPGPVQVCLRAPVRVLEVLAAVERLA